MGKPLCLFFFALICFPLILLAEGSKQLTPNKSTAALTSTSNDKAGYLAHDANLPSATGVAITSLSFLKPAGFSRNGATYSKDHRLYIRVKAGETLYYGVRRAIHDQTTANQANLTITVRRTNAATGVDDAVYAQANTLTANTSSTRDMLLVANQNGVIDTPTEADNGPNRSAKGIYPAVTAGYTPLTITNNTGTDYDYYVEFTQVGESSWTDDGRRFSVYDLWDFTVIDAAGAEKPGRLRSKLWSFSAGGTSNVFSKDFNMFPLVPSQDQTGKFFVKKVELAGIAPQNFFRFVTNSAGSAAAAGSATERRKSQTSQTDYPEYFNFVNDPDPAIWPSADAPTFSVAMASSCNTSTGGGKTAFNLTSSESSTFLVLLNLNGTAGYQAGTADVLLEASGAKGTRTLEWNGLNGLGQVVAKNTSMNYFFRNGSAPLHFPVWDAEWNDGFRVMDVRPLAAGATADYSLLFWDDTNLPATSFPTRSELFGVSSATNVHTWGSATTTAGDLKTVNTWTYGFTSAQQQTATFTYDCSADVGLTQTAAAAPYTIGKPFTYTLTATNNGPLPATNVKVTELLDAAKLQFVSASDAAYNSTTGIWEVGSLLTGASRTLTLTALPLVTGSITATASQTHTEADNVTANNTAATTITVVPAADIEVKQSVPGTAYTYGEVVTFTVTAKNLGPNAATGVVVQDKLPAGLTLAGAAPAGYDAATGNWTVGTLAVNETKTLTLAALISAQGVLTTTAALADRTGLEVDNNASNNTSSTSITVAPAADVALTNVVSNATPNQNGSITYTITARNNGPNNATNVVVSGALPASLSLSSYNASVGTVAVANGTLTWQAGTIPAGATQTLVLTASPTATGTYTMSFTQSHTEADNNSGNNTATSTITVQPTAEVAVTNVVVSPVKTTYANGDQVTYQVTVTNNGPSTATNLAVTDLLPSTLTFNSATPSAGTYAAGTGLWQVGTLASGATATLSLTATINQSAVITTTATQTHTENDNVIGNNSASNSITSGGGIPAADIQVTIVPPTGTFYTGKDLTFIARVDNTGPDAATGVKLQVPVPAGFSLKSADPRVGTYDPATGTWDLGQLASGAYTGLFLVLTPNVDNSVTGAKNLSFAAALTAVKEVDDDGTNNSASTTIQVQKAADVAVGIDVTGDVNGVFYQGLTEATFTMKLTNNGPDKATNLQGLDTRTGRIQFTYAEPGKGYNPATGIWLVPELAAGETITLTVKGIPLFSGRSTLGGTKQSQDQADLNPENDRAVALIQVLPAADLEVTNNVAAATMANGQPTTFTVTVTNKGAAAATGVTLSDALPAGLSLVSASPSAGAYDPATGIWTLGTDLLPGAAQTLVLTVKPTATGTFTTTAAVATAGEFDNVTANNSQAASFQSQPTADIALSNTMASGPYYVGGQYLVTIRATNLGPDPATGVVVGAGVAPGLRLVPGSGTPDAGSSIDPATGIWTIGSLAVGESKNLTLLAEPLTLGTLNSLGFKMAATEFDPDGGNTRNGNNSTLISFTVSDRPATVQVWRPNQHQFLLQTGNLIASISDPDGPISNARLVGGTLPEGMALLANGDLAVASRNALRPGAYTLTVETTDDHGGITQNTFSFTVSGDWDGDGVADVDDIDDNNDGIITEPGAVNPTDDADGDGIYNYLDRDFVHPLFGAFTDRNLDGVHDAFDLDLDGLIRGYDLDIDGDGIPNAIEANGGVAPAGYNPLTATFDGGVSANGMPLAVQTSPNSGVSVLPQPDTDGDGYRDYQDQDADNDGIDDNMEAQATSAYRYPTGSDQDLDGLDDAYDPSCGCGLAGTALGPVNTDAADLPDYRDVNSDNDAYEDFVESVDEDEDGITLGDYLTRAAAFTEKTGLHFYPVQDSDGNGVPDWLERRNGIFTFLSFGSAFYYDTDRDGLVDLFDRDNGGAVVSQGLVTVPGSSPAVYEYASRISQIAIPLPVELLSFTATAGKKGVQLKWETAMEKNNAYFSLERSSDGTNFQAIAQIAGAGTTHQVVQYGHLDTAPPTGRLYYRLRQVDFNGQEAYSSIVTVASSAANPAVSVNLFPNPTTGPLHLDLSASGPETVTVTLYALDGRQLRRLELAGGRLQSLDFSSLPAGAYLLKLQNSNLEVMKRFVKQ